MKSARPLLVTLAVVIGLLAVAFALAFTPAVQAWAVRRAVAGQPGMKLEFAQLSAGLSRASLRDVRFEQDGLVVEAGELDARYSAWEFLTSKRLRIEELRARGVSIDASSMVSTPAPSQAAAVPVATPGALARTELPWEVFIGRIDVAGRALLPSTPGRAAIPAEFQVTGGGIAPGTEGELLLKAQLTDPSPAAMVASLHADSRLVVRQTRTRTFDRVALTMVVDAEGPQFADRTQLKVAAEMLAGDDREGYRLSVDTLVGGRAENLVQVDATLPANADRYAGEWKLQARAEQVRPFFLGGHLPQFSVRGGGDFSFLARSAAFTVRGRLDGEASQLETIDASLRELGRLRFDSEFDLAEEEGVVRLTQLRANAAGEQPLLSLELKRALEVTLETKSVQVAGGAGEVAALQLHHFPLTWISPLVPDLEIRGGVVSGQFSVQNGEGQLRLRSSEPTRIAGLTLVRDGQALLEQAEISLRNEAVWRGQELTFDASEFSLRTPAGDRLTAEAVAKVLVSDDQNAPIEVKLRFDGDFPRLLDVVASLGHLQMRGEADVRLAGDDVRVGGFELRLADGNGRPLLAARGATPFVFNQQAAQVRIDGAQAEIARVEVPAMSLATQSFVQAIMPVSGELAAAEIVAMVRGGRLFISSANPLRLTNVSLEEGGVRMLERLSFETAPNLEFASLADWKFALGQTSVRNGSGTLATLGIEASVTASDGFRSAVTFNVDLAALGTQPLFAGAGALSAGRASGEMRAAFDEAKEPGVVLVEARATLNGLVLREGNQPLPVANVSARAVRSADGRFSLEAPILLDRLGQRSELRLTAEALKREEGYLFDARLSGDHLELADALVLAGVFSAAPTATNASPATNASSATAPRATGPVVSPRAAVADTVPFWQGVRGEMAVNFKSITRGKEWAMTNVGGYLLIDPRRIAVQKFEGLINERSRFGARADLRFGEGARPYSLVGNFSLTEFDAGAFLRAFQPEQPPTIEGIVTVAGGFTGDGATLDQTIERTRGHVQLTSSKGVFRGLRRTTEKASMATKAVEIGAALGSLFGSNRVREAAEKVAGQTYQIDQLVQMLGEIPFDQFVVRAQRDDRLNFRLEEFSLLSPEVRLTGRGSLNYVEGRPLLEMPITVNYHLSARGRVEEQLARLRVLDGTKDELGYSKVRDTGTIGGTLSRPDASQFFLKLAESKVGDMLAPRN